MPRYFFHVRDGQQEPDHVGKKLDDWDGARQHAVRLAGRISTMTRNGWHSASFGTRRSRRRWPDPVSPRLSRGCVAGNDPWAGINRLASIFDAEHDRE